jgi:chromosome segregation ATPase
MDEKAFEKAIEMARASHNTEIERLKLECESLETASEKEEKKWGNEKAELTSKRNQLQQKINGLKKKLNDTKTEAKIYFKNHENLKNKLNGHSPTSTQHTEKRKRELTAVNEKTPTQDNEGTSDPSSRRRKLNFENTNMHSQAINYTPLSLIDVEDSQAVDNIDYDSDGSIDLSQASEKTTTTTHTSEYSVDFAAMSNRR